MKLEQLIKQLKQQERLLGGDVEVVVTGLYWSETNSVAVKARQFEKSCSHCQCKATLTQVVLETDLCTGR